MPVRLETYPLWHQPSLTMNSSPFAIPTQQPYKVIIPPRRPVTNEQALSDVDNTRTPMVSTIRGPTLRITYDD